VFTVRSVLGKVTVWPDTAVAVPIPGHAVAPDGRFVVVTVQFKAVPFTVKSAGNVTWTSASVWTVRALAQTVPLVAVAAFILSSLNVASRNVAALALGVA
jgi:hypothetical protein